MKKLNKQLKVVLELSYGSDFQQEFYDTILIAFFDTVEAKMKATHKKNKIRVKYII